MQEMWELDKTEADERRGEETLTHIILMDDLKGNLNTDNGSGIYKELP